MTRRMRWLALQLVVILLVPSMATAQDEESESTSETAAPAEIHAPNEVGPVNLIELETERRTRTRFYPISTRVDRYLSAASEAMGEDDNAQAAELLKRLNPERMNPYERAYVFRLLAYVYYTTGEYALAIENFYKVLDQEALGIVDEARIRFNIAQLYAALQQWRDVITTIQRWFFYTLDPSPMAFYLLAVAHYQLGEVGDAVLYAEMAVDASAEPSESWLQLLAALYVQDQDYASAAPVFEELLMRYPKKQYWVQLSLIYGANDSYRHALAIQQIAYLQGFLTEDDELRRLARSYLYANLPHEAATLMEKGLDEGKIKPEPESYTLLANSWIQAREFDRSREPLATAAELSEDGNLYIRLGQVYMQREEWNQAAELLKKAIAKGGLDNPGMAQLLLGISYYNDDRVRSARSSFARARKHEKTRKQANDWLAHIDREAEPG